jgi:carboxymethylenebutenolidase
MAWFSPPEPARGERHLPAEIEVYAGTVHDWCPPDARVYNHDQAEKAWSRMLALFSSSLA